MKTAAPTLTAAETAYRAALLKRAEFRAADRAAEARDRLVREARETARRFGEDE